MAVITLLDNAVTYSPRDTSIQVEVTLHYDARNSTQVSVVIHDQGPGIPAAEADLALDRFSRVDESRTRDTGGAGLGLAIAKWSIEADGGNILLNSSPDSGSVFSILLPQFF